MKPGPFTVALPPARVIFRRDGLSDIPTEVAALGWKRALVLSTPGRRETAEQVAVRLGGASAGTWAKARMHVPADVVDEAAAHAALVEADGCVAVGGGSTTGLAKALALRASLPYVAVPTTYAGSEATPIWGLTEGRVKSTGRDPAVLPLAVVYDPDLVEKLPPATALVSAMNALAHAVEALYAPDASAFTNLLAEEGVRRMAAALTPLAGGIDSGRNPETGLRALYGAWLCGTVLGTTTMSLHHKLCHVLGGSLDLPHAEVHAVLLPYVLAFNAPAAAPAVRALQRALTVDPDSPAAGHDPTSVDPAQLLQSLTRQLGGPTSLAEVGMNPADVETVVRQVTGNPYANPRAAGPAEVRSLVLAALLGDPVSV